MTNELIIAIIGTLILIAWLNILDKRIVNAEDQIKSLRRDTKELMEELENREKKYIEPQKNCVESEKIHRAVKI